MLFLHLQGNLQVTHHWPVQLQQINLQTALSLHFTDCMKTTTVSDNTNINPKSHEQELFPVWGSNYKRTLNRPKHQQHNYHFNTYSWARSVQWLLWAGRLGFDSWHGTISLRRNVQTGSGSHPASYTTGTSVVPSGIKRQGCEATH
jgi:hypothetical protein